MTCVTNFTGKLIKTENAVEGGNDGLVVAEDGTKYVSSVRQERTRLSGSSRGWLLSSTSAATCW